jgi:fatty acid desaturase
MSAPPLQHTSSVAASYPRPEKAPVPPVELPTLLLIFATYAGWLAITYAYQDWPLAIVAPLAALLITFHSSLQHEIVHGHPTRWRGLNRYFGIVPLTIWLPYERYKQTHHAHHRDERLTDPMDDPESFYWEPEQWARLTPIRRAFIRAEHTLAGRILIGSFWRIGLFLASELRAVVRGEPGVRAAWLEHLLWCVPIVLWVTIVCGIPLWIYFVAMVVPANAIQLIRSFAEHLARPAVPERIAIVERSWLLGPLFLYNNLHLMHHESPGVPWYRCSALYRRERDRLLALNGGLVYKSYFDVARRYLFRVHDVMTHPTGRVPARGV